MPVLNIGSGYPMEWVDSESGPCLVVAGAACVWADLQPFFGAEYAGKFAGRYDVLCVNDITMHFPGPVKHVYSNNHRYLDLWVRARRDSLLSTYGPVKATHSHHVGGKVTWPWTGAGTSSLGATLTALALGYDPVILCGIPLDDTPHYFEPPWVKSTFSKQVPPKGNGSIKYWHDAAQNIFQGRVKVRSGRLTQILEQV